MRALGLLVLLAIVLGFGVVPVPASAEPCPFHPHEAAVVEDKARTTEATLASTAISGTTIVVAALVHPGPPAPHPVSDHPIPAGEFCCHVAAAVTPALGPVLEPYHGTASRLFLHAGLPPWATPTSDIYRPPAIA